MVCDHGQKTAHSVSRSNLPYPVPRQLPEGPVHRGPNRITDTARQGIGAATWSTSRTAIAPTAWDSDGDRKRRMKLFLKVALFTVVMPGTFAGLLPPLIVGDRAVAGGPTLGVAYSLFAFGIVIYLRSAWDFATFGGGTPAPIDAPKRLVTRGFYRYTRNPMYVASLTVVMGWATLFEAAVLVGYAIALFVAFSLFIRLYEEPRLAREFGEEYTTYVSQVGRWLPRLSHLKMRR